MQLAGAVADPNEVNALARQNSISNAMIIGTTTSSSYADLPDAPTSLTFVKLSSSTTLRVEGKLTLYSTGGSGVVRLGVSVNGTDYDLHNRTLSTTDVWGTVGGFTRITGLAAGSYTVQLRWRRVSGAGTLTVNTDAWVNLEAMEVQG
jgi:hypothetical protein